MTTSTWRQLRNQLRRLHPEARQRAEELLKREFDQAWAHYRQIETARTQHVGFLIAACFALGPILKVVIDFRTLGDFRPVIGVLLGAAYTGVAVVILLAVRRANAVLSHYEGVFRQVRILFYEDLLDDASSLLDVRSHPGVAGQPFSISRSTSGACLLAAIGLPLSTVASAGVVAAQSQYGWPKYLALAIAVIAWLLSTAVLAHRRRVRRLTAAAT